MYCSMMLRKAKKRIWLGVVFFFGGGINIATTVGSISYPPLYAKDLCTVTDSALVGKRITGRK